MPKISGSDIPSYAGHAGHVTNAVGVQFEVDPTRDLNGDDTDGLKVEPVGEPNEELVNTSGPITLKDADTEEREPAEDEQTAEEHAHEKENREHEGRTAEVNATRDSKEGPSSAGSSSKTSSGQQQKNTASKPASNR